MFTRIRKRSRVFIPAAFIAAILLSNPLNATGQSEVDKINREIRNKGAKWVAGETSISRLPAEQRRMRLGLIEPAGGARQMLETPLAANALTASASAPVLPARLRYASKIVTPVKDQGDCGSCWAFAVTAALESHVAMTTGELTNLSEQVLICKAGWEASVDPPCGGGYPEGASYFLQNPGLPKEDFLRYNTHQCGSPSPGWESNTYRISRALEYYFPRVRAMKEVLYAYGPIVATLYVYSDFYNYTGGVYSYTSGQYEGGHVVEVIGYDDNQQCFIAKNSWGAAWGEAGYFNIAYSQVNAWAGVAFGGTTIAYDGEGTLQVTSSYQCGDQCTDPGVVPPDAQWRVDGGPWHAASDATLVLNAGKHILEFMDYNGWITPAPRTVIVRKGKTIQAQGSYVLPTGALKVVIRPQGAIAAGARCNVDGGAWQNNSAPFSLLPGRHVARFKDIDGWITPAKVVTTTANGGQTTQVKGVYVQRTGSVTVTITRPRAVNKGAQWRLDNGNWNNSGAVITAGVGQHTLTFSSVSGWTAPADRVLTVREGKTRSVSVEYTP